MNLCDCWLLRTGSRLPRENDMEQLLKLKLAQLQIATSLGDQATMDIIVEEILEMFDETRDRAYHSGFCSGRGE